MNLIKIFYDGNYNTINNKKNKYLLKIKSIINDYLVLIILVINIIIINYLLIENKKNKKIIKDIISLKTSFLYKKIIPKNDYPNNDKDMIGLYYPDINYDKIKKGIINFNITESLIELINQIETKLIFLEKEINVTKLVSFYISRKHFLKERNITYDENNLKELHDIINWIIIHKSNQLKGIASDKYLACKYVELKLQKNLCEHRIAVYDRIEELSYEELSKYGDIALKISNSCWKTIFISNNTKIYTFKSKMKEIKKLLESEHGLLEAQFFHLYARRRIIIEKQLIPSNDLYEFKFFIINKEIKFIYLLYFLNNTMEIFIYDNNFNFIFREKELKSEPLNLTSLFKKEILQQLKIYAIKLSEDFPNFIRVDLYLFHEKIYFSELTFASYNGLPMFRNEKFINHSLENFSRIDDYY